MKTIKFKNDWRYSRQGDVIEEGDGVAELLIARGIAEEVPSDGSGTEETNTEDEDVEENQAEATPDVGSSEDTGTEQFPQDGDEQDGGENALPQIITRQVPGPNEGRSRRGGRG